MNEVFGSWDEIILILKLLDIKQLTLHENKKLVERSWCDDNKSSGSL